MAMISTGTQLGRTAAQAMLEALLWGVVASSSLLLGGVLTLRFSISNRVLGLVMAFGAGVLISSVSFELVEEAFDTSMGGGGVGLGLFAGAGTFYLGDALLDRLGAEGRRARQASRRVARRWPSCSASSSTVSPSQQFSASLSSRQAR